jgi:hypothetical protein
MTTEKTTLDMVNGLTEIADYMQDEEYTTTLLSGDIHEKNRQAAGLAITPLLVISGASLLQARVRRRFPA